MHDYNHQEGDQEFKDLVSQYEEMVANDAVAFLEPKRFEQLIDYYHQHLMVDKAIEVADIALLQHPFVAYFYMRKAQLLMEEEEYQEAEDMLGQALLFEPSNMDVYLTRADLYIQQLDHERAIDLLQEARQFADKEDLIDISVLEATIYETQGHYRKAFKCLKKAVMLDPFNELAMSRMWVNVELADLYEESIPFHLKVIDEAPYSPWAWFNLGHSYMQLDLYERAAEAYDYTLVIDDQFSYAYRDIANCLVKLEEYEEALQYIEDYFSFFKADAEMLVLAGECHEYFEDYAKARDYYVKALKKDHLDGQVYYRLGVCYAHEGSWIQAQKMFEKAQRSDTDNEEFCIALAEAYNQLEQTDKAHEYYHQAIELAPEIMDSWIHYIEFLIDEQSYAFALETVEEASQYCDGAKLDFARVAVLIESGARQEGFVLLGKILSRGIRNMETLFQIAPDLKDDYEVIRFITNYG